MRDPFRDPGFGDVFVIGNTIWGVAGVNDDSIGIVDLIDGERRLIPKSYLLENASQIQIVSRSVSESEYQFLNSQRYSGDA